MSELAFARAQCVCHEGMRARLCQPLGVDKAPRRGKPKPKIQIRGKMSSRSHLWHSRGKCPRVFRTKTLRRR